MKKIIFVLAIIALTMTSCGGVWSIGRWYDSKKGYPGFDRPRGAFGK